MFIFIRKALFWPEVIPGAVHVEPLILDHICGLPTHLIPLECISLWDVHEDTTSRPTKEQIILPDVLMALANIYYNKNANYALENNMF